MEQMWRLCHNIYPGWGPNGAVRWPAASAPSSPSINNTLVLDFQKCNCGNAVVQVCVNSPVTLISAWFEFLKQHGKGESQISKCKLNQLHLTHSSHSHCSNSFRDVTCIFWNWQQTDLVIQIRFNFAQRLLIRDHKEVTVIFCVFWDQHD